MPLTLAQAKSLSQDKLTQDVIDDFRASPLLDMMTFDNNAKAQGGASFTYTYNRIKTQSKAASRALNTEYTPSEADTELVTVQLDIFGGSFQIDRALAENEWQVVDLFDFQMTQKVKAARALFHNYVINGNNAAGTPASGAGFDGLEKLITGTATDYTPAATIDISTASAIDTNAMQFGFEMRQALKKMNGTPDLMLVNSDLYAALNSVSDKLTSFNITKSAEPNYVGSEILRWGNIRIMEMGDYVDANGALVDVIPTDEDTGETTAYFVRMGLDAFHGVTPEGNNMVRTYFPDMTAAGAVKTGEVEMLAAIAVKSQRSVAKINGIKVA